MSPAPRRNDLTNLNPGRVRGGVRGKRMARGMGVSLEARPDAEDVEAVLHHEFWRAPAAARSPLRLVWTAQR